MDVPSEQMDTDVLEWIESETPIPAADVGFKAIIAGANEHSAFVFYWKLDGKRVRLVMDALTCHMLKKVYDAASDEFKVKMDNIVRKGRANLVLLVDKCWKCVK